MSLYDKLCNYDTLWQSWLQVKKKKSAGGIDKISVYEFDLVADVQIKQIQEQLSENTYLPQPYKSAYIKKNKKGYRPLGLLSISDKIVQQAINTLIYPIIDNQLSSNCYAYRHKKGAIKAVGRVIANLFIYVLNYGICESDPLKSFSQQSITSFQSTINTLTVLCQKTLYFRKSLKKQNSQNNCEKKIRRNCQICMILDDEDDKKYKKLKRLLQSFAKILCVFIKFVVIPTCSLTFCTLN